jgi:predicted RND superfamily exporter protein
MSAPISDKRHYSTENNFAHENNSLDAVNPYSAMVTHQAKDVNGKMKLAKKICSFEQDRVEKHKMIRENQLVINQENRTMQIINERKKTRQEKDFRSMLKEISEEKEFKFNKLSDDRALHYKKVQDKFSKLDNLGHDAYQDHIVDVGERQARYKEMDKEMST